MTVEELFDKMTKCDLFIGKYDAENGNRHFMFGVASVMEYIANEISEETLVKFTDEFHGNMIDSENKI